MHSVQALAWPVPLNAHNFGPNGMSAPSRGPLTCRGASSAWDSAIIGDCLTRRCCSMSPRSVLCAPLSPQELPPFRLAGTIEGAEGATFPIRHSRQGQGLDVSDRAWHRPPTPRRYLPARIGACAFSRNSAADSPRQGRSGQGPYQPGPHLSALSTSTPLDHPLTSVSPLAYVAQVATGPPWWARSLRGPHQPGPHLARLAPAPHASMSALSTSAPLDRPLTSTSPLAHAACPRFHPWPASPAAPWTRRSGSGACRACTSQAHARARLYQRAARPPPHLGTSTAASGAREGCTSQAEARLVPAPPLTIRTASPPLAYVA
eukprot:CAMPEP_0205909006 /NCGR_PEP_ID=MMETSP1325-20131115/3580_1 /ASSEMBLY_ACC=CAM_ASM_000708 /TAXON_ID=236786 /ORGANISM="Florenciella sp., Strain RCC1007" /LENGTH=318 /DNA_ID=CAMNT_0053275267 /DNA_START=31 /DNA_END=986 /DNA_ORIENTATION=+